MRLAGTTLRLHSHYPIQVGLNKRTIHSPIELQHYVESNNGISDCFASIGTLNFLLNKIYIDIDSPRGVEGAFEEACKIHLWLIENGYDVIPVISGKKGFNEYILLKPKRYANKIEAKSLLKNATHWILCQIFGYGRDNSIIKTDTIDPQIIGDVSRISRIPDTLRPPENLTWCTYLPLDFPDMDIGEVILLMKEPQMIEYDISMSLPTLNDFPEAPENVRVTRKTKQKPITTQHKGSVQIRDHSILKDLLRPCLYRHLMMRNPLDIVRVAVTADLQQFFTRKEIFEMYKSLGWLDWDPQKTMHWIDSIGDRGLHPFGCKKLRELGIPNECCEE